MGSEKTHFRLIGIVTSSEFQRCRCYINRLHKCYPKEFESPYIRPMLNVDWAEYLTKVRRNIGGKLWALEVAAAVFVNGRYLGDDSDLLKFISRKFKFSLSRDFEKLGNDMLIDMITKDEEVGCNFVYMTISIEDNIVGSLLFRLYTYFVPRTCENFIKRCKRKRNGYVGTAIHRIAKPCWIQCGGWNLKHKKIPCENYIIPHDRRGVLSMCHNGKHTDNSTQFFVSLGATPWMDYKYVAFGHLVQGEEVLKLIEDVPTEYEFPQKHINIVNAGELNLYPEPDLKAIEELAKYLSTKDMKTSMPKDVIDVRDIASVLSVRRYKKGMYCLPTDMKSYLPFLHLPDHLLFKYLKCRHDDTVEEEGNIDVEKGFPFDSQLLSRLAENPDEHFIF